MKTIVKNYYGFDFKPSSTTRYLHEEFSLPLIT